MDFKQKYLKYKYKYKILKNNLICGNPEFDAIFIFGSTGTVGRALVH